MVRALAVASRPRRQRALRSRALRCDDVGQSVSLRLVVHGDRGRRDRGIRRVGRPRRRVLATLRATTRSPVPATPAFCSMVGHAAKRQRGGGGGGARVMYLARIQNRPYNSFVMLMSFGEAAAKRSNSAEEGRHNRSVSAWQPLCYNHQPINPALALPRAGDRQISYCGPGI